MATTIKIPLELLTVEVNSANAFWTAKSGANIDQAHIAFVDAGNGSATFWGYLPNNLNATPAWNLDIGHYAESGSGGNVVVTFAARAYSNNLIDAAPTVISSAAVIAVNTSGTYTYSAVSGGDFDSAVSVSATNIIIVEATRHGGNAGDTVNAQWNLHTVVMRCDIT